MHWRVFAEYVLIIDGNNLFDVPSFERLTNLSYFNFKIWFHEIL